MSVMKFQGDTSKAENFKQVKAKQGMLAFLPACAKAGPQPPAAEIIHCRGYTRSQRRMPDGDWRDQRTEFNALGV
jgi:hypothetical protein